MGAVKDMLQDFGGDIALVGFPEAWLEPQLRVAFVPLGGCASVKLSQTPSGQRVALVQLRDGVNAATVAQRLLSSILGGKGLQIETAAAPSAAAGPAAPPGKSAGGRSWIVTVTGIPLSWSKQQVEERFARYGALRSIRFLRRPRDNGGAKAASVAYRSPAHARTAAMQMHGAELDGSALHCALQADVDGIAAPGATASAASRESRGTASVPAKRGGDGAAAGNANGGEAARTAEGVGRKRRKQAPARAGTAAGRSPGGGDKGGGVSLLARRSREEPREAEDTAGHGGRQTAEPPKQQDQRSEDASSYSADYSDAGDAPGRNAGASHGVPLQAPPGNWEPPEQQRRRGSGAPIEEDPYHWQGDRWHYRAPPVEAPRTTEADAPTSMVERRSPPTQTPELAGAEKVARGGGSGSTTASASSGPLTADDFSARYKRLVRTLLVRKVRGVEREQGKKAAG
mmetsp:Transcript_119994/g.340172  ORF Transcript_119994/g.340172 Transcript_119994/m.340172 type:complete len:457 (+) Transcript_119994:160-1530(+)